MINNLKVLTTISFYREIKYNFDALYEFTKYNDYDVNFLKKIPESYFTDPASTQYHGSHKHGLLIHSCNVALLTYRNLKEMKEMKISKYLNNTNDEEFDKYLREGVFAGLFHDFCKVGCYIPERLPSEKQLNFVLSLIDDLCLTQETFTSLYLNKLGIKSIGKLIDGLIKLKQDMENDLVSDNDVFVSKIEELNKITCEYEWRDDLPLGHGEKSIILLQQLGVMLSEHQLFAIYNHQNEMDPKWQLPFERKRILIHTDKIPMQKSIILAEKISGFLYEYAKEY